MTEDCFNFNSFNWKEVEGAEITYPVPQMYSMKLTTPKKCRIFPMETSEYGRFLYPSTAINLISDFDINSYEEHISLANPHIQEKIAELYGIPKTTEQFYIGRSVASEVCNILTINLKNVSSF